MLPTVAHHLNYLVNNAETSWRKKQWRGSAWSAHLNAAGRRSFKMQAPGWTLAILPLALSMLASDTGSSTGAQPATEKREERGSRISTLPLDTSNKDAVWMVSGKRKWKVNLPFMEVFAPVQRGKCKNKCWHCMFLQTIMEKTCIITSFTCVCFKIQLRTFL